MHRSFAFLIAPLVAAMALTAACGSSDDSSGDADFSAAALDRSQKAMTAQLIGSQLGLGPSRLAFGILRPDPKDPQAASLVHDAAVRLHLYKLAGDDQATAAGDYELNAVSLTESTDHLHDDGTKHLHDDPLITVYVVNLELDRTDWWGASLDIEVDGKEYSAVKTKFFVAEKTTEPAIGQPVPPSTQLTTRDVPDIKLIDSSSTPRPHMHDMTVAEAVKNGKPTVVAFATPAFCQTRYCGPVVDSVIAPLHAKYGSRVNFLHIEPYKLEEARKGRLVAIPEVQQWGLASEPWVFVLDSRGLVLAKYEGVMSQEELGPVIERALGGQAARSGPATAPR